MSSRSARTATLAALVLAIMSATAHAAPPSAYVYATSFDHVVRQYSADEAGALSALIPVGAPADDASTSVAASPDGRSLYVVNQGSDSVSQYEIGFDGTLTPKVPATVSTGAFPFSISIAPDGAHAYVANQDDASVTVYDIGADGRLAEASEAPAGAGARQVAFTPDGAHAYVANGAAGTVSEYDVDADGSLSPDGEVTTPAPAAIALSADGSSAYVANRSAGTISQFSIGAGGSLAPKSPATVAAGATPMAVVATADSVYASNFADATISQYSVQADGSLMAKASPTVPTGSDPWGLAVAPDGESLYAAAFSDRGVYQYDVGADGELVAKAPPSVVSGLRPAGVAAVPVRDGTAPTIDLRAPASGAQYDVGAEATVDYSCADEGGSGVAACDGDLANGAALDTSTPGEYSFTVTARDGVGNTASVTHTYTVADRGSGNPVPEFGGFLGSIQDGARVKAGTAVPIVFSLGGDFGLDVLAAGSPWTGRVDCRAPGRASGWERALSKDGRGLRYNPSTGHYVFVWQTKRSWNGTCRAFVLKLADGSLHRLVVSFRSKQRSRRH